MIFDTRKVIVTKEKRWTLNFSAFLYFDIFLRVGSAQSPPLFTFL